MFYSKVEVDCRSETFSTLASKKETVEEARNQKPPMIKFQNNAELTGYLDVVREACVEALGK